MIPNHTTLRKKRNVRKSLKKGTKKESITNARFGLFFFLLHPSYTKIVIVTSSNGRSTVQQVNVCGWKGKRPENGSEEGSSQKGGCSAEGKDGR